MDDDQKRATFLEFLQSTHPGDGRSKEDIARRTALADFINLATRKDFMHQAHIFAVLRHDFTQEPEEQREIWVLYNAALDIYERAWLNLREDRPVPVFATMWERSKQERAAAQELEQARLERVAGFEADQERAQAQLRADLGLAADGGPGGLPAPPMPLVR